MNKLGDIANQIWKEIPNHFTHVKLHEFIIMPNHMHGIIEITENRGGIPGGNGASTYHEGTRLIASLRDTKSINNEQKNSSGGATGIFNPMFYQNISRIMRWYKGRCSYEIRKMHTDFKWQSRFHDHIIREYDSYCRIADYINNNPKMWEKDKLKK